MKIRNFWGDTAFDILNTLFMCFIMLIMLYPMLNVLAVSLSSPQAITAGRVSFYPKGFNIEGYKYIFSDPKLFIGYRNSVFYAVSSTALMLLVTSLVAYALSLKHFVLRKFFTVFLSITMFFSGGMIPTYLLMRSIGFLNTIWVMIIPGCVSACNVFVFRTFFQQQPLELRESAYMDGANDFLIWLRIIIPLSKPIFATYGLFHIVGTWNSWFGALLYLTREDLHPIQMFLRKIVINMDQGSGYSDSARSMLMMEGKFNPQNIQMATIIIVMVPILCIYPFVQRYFVKGALIGAIKG